MFRKYSVFIVLLIVGLVQTACSSTAQEAGQVQGIPWWAWLLIIVVMAALFLWLWLSEPKKKAAPPTRSETAAPTAKPEIAAPVAWSEVAAPSQVVDTPMGMARRAPPMADDLTRIEGIGPKISGLFQAAGIMTFAQLATSEVSRLKEILAEAGFRAPANPTTWPEQANLAATGQWDALEALQGELKGGRRV